MREIKVVIVDDHTLFRRAMVKLLNTEVKVIGDAENGKDLLKMLRNGLNPEVVLLDLQMAVMDGVTTAEILLREYPLIKVIILTMHDSEKYIRLTIEMGVHGFLLKHTEPEELFKAIKNVIEDGYYMSDLVRSVFSGRKEKGTDLWSEL